MTAAVLTDDQRALFAQTIELCRSLKARGMVRSGYDYYANEKGVVSVRAIPPMGIPGLPAPDPEEITRKGLAAYQRLRAWLGLQFDIESAKWNASNIGRALSVLEKELRVEANRTQADAEDSSGVNTYNAFTIVALSMEAIELHTLVSSEKFRRMWQWRKKVELDNFALRFFRNNDKRKLIQGVSAPIELLLVVDEILKKGINPAMEGFVAQIVTTGALEKLRSQLVKLK